MSADEGGRQRALITVGRGAGIGNKTPTMEARLVRPPEVAAEGLQEGA